MATREDYIQGILGNIQRVQNLPPPKPEPETCPDCGGPMHVWYLTGQTTENGGEPGRKWRCDDDACNASLMVLADPDEEVEDPVLDALKDVDDILDTLITAIDEGVI